MKQTNFTNFSAFSHIEQKDNFQFIAYRFFLIKIEDENKLIYNKLDNRIEELYKHGINLNEIINSTVINIDNVEYKNYTTHKFKNFKVINKNYNFIKFIKITILRSVRSFYS